MFRSVRETEGCYYIREQECARWKNASRRGHGVDQQSTGHRLGFIPLSPRSSPEGGVCQLRSRPSHAPPAKVCPLSHLIPSSRVRPLTGGTKTNQGGHGGRCCADHPTSIKRPNETKSNYGPTGLRGGRSTVGAEEGQGGETSATVPANIPCDTDPAPVIVSVKQNFPRGMRCSGVDLDDHLACKRSVVITERVEAWKGKTSP